jgi:hypothetical protein
MSSRVVGVPNRYENRAHPGFKSESLLADPEPSVTNDSPSRSIRKNYLPEESAHFTGNNKIR